MRRLLLISTLLTLTLAAAAVANDAPKASAAVANDAPKARASIVGGHAASISQWPSIAFLAAGWDSDQDGQIDAIAGCTGNRFAF